MAAVTSLLVAVTASQLPHLLSALVVDNLQKARLQLMKLPKNFYGPPLGVLSPFPNFRKLCLKTGATSAPRRFLHIAGCYGCHISDCAHQGPPENIREIGNEYQERLISVRANCVISAFVDIEVLDLLSRKVGLCCDACIFFFWLK